MKTLTSPALFSWPGRAGFSFFSCSFRSKALIRCLLQALLLGSAALLVACSGGGGRTGNETSSVPTPGGDGGGGSTSITPLVAPATPSSISLGTATIKTLNFQWSAVAGATHYKLFEDLDGAAGMGAAVEIASGSPITTTTYAHEVPLYERLNASYTLQACNDAGCSADSPAFKPSIADLNAAIGYAKATGGGVANDGYGTAVALSADGQTLAVGAPFESATAASSGAVYVMRRTAIGQWSAPEKLKDPTPDPDEQFGRSLALSADGSVLAVGVPGGIQPVGGGVTANTGHVQVFTFNGAGFAPSYTVVALNRAAADSFGHSVALDASGQVLAVGAPFQHGASLNEGAAYVYTRSGNSWGNEQFITASHPVNGDQMGYAVALSGDGQTLALGAPSENGGLGGIHGLGAVAALTDESLLDAGAVYVFSRAGTAASDLFANQVYIKASQPGLSDALGLSVALNFDGSVLAAGAAMEDSADTGVNANALDNGSPQSGAVYVFVRDNLGLWSQQAYIKASNTSEDSWFGYALALSSDGHTLAVGAPYEKRSDIGLGADPFGGPTPDEHGAAYLFRRDADGLWAQSNLLKSPTAGIKHAFGVAVSLCGDGGSLAVGNPQEDHQAGGPALNSTNPKAGPPLKDHGTAVNSGAAYLF